MLKASSAAERQSLRERAYKEIKSAIIANTLDGGTPLSEHTLAKALRVSRTPVRDALGRLESEGFISYIPGKGAFVRPVSVEFVLEVLEYREAVEGFACRLTALRMSDALRAELVARFLREEPPKGVEALNQSSEWFHQLIRAQCGNRMLQVSLDRIRDHLARLRTVAVRIPGRVEQSFVEHKAIVQALADRDEERAEAEMRRHIASTRTTIAEAVLDPDRLALHK